MNSGSCFFAEIRRMTSSLKPAGIVSASISVTKPYLYSPRVKSSTLGVAVFIGKKLLVLRNHERLTAAASFLDVRILKDKPRLHELVFVIEFGATQVEQARS